MMHAHMHALPRAISGGRPRQLFSTAWLLCMLQAAAVPASAQRIDTATAAGLPQPQQAKPTLPQRPALRLARAVSPGTLASNQASKRLLEALRSMLAEHPDVLKARAALESAGHDLNTARGARWPTFKVGTSSGSTQLKQSGSSYTALNAEMRMKLLDGGAIEAGIRSAQLQEAAQSTILDGTRQNVLLDALTALLELQRLDHKVRVANIIGQLARVEERRAELGAVGRNDLRQAASRQAGALAQQHALESQRMDALARFTRYFNFTPESTWLPRLEIPAQWMPANEGAALQASENHSPELQEIAQQIERANAEVDRSKAQRFPTLSAVVARTHDPKGVLYADGTRYGVELNWNFGNGFELQDRILKAINELQAKEAQQEAVRRQVRETASASWGRTQAGRQRETQLADAVREARAVFEGRRRLLEVGRGTLAQVLDAQLDMQRLMLDEADAIYDQRTNELRLVRTTGQLLPKDMPEHWLDRLFLSAPPPVHALQDTAPAPLAQPLLFTRTLQASLKAPPYPLKQSHANPRSW